MWAVYESSVFFFFGLKKQKAKYGLLGLQNTVHYKIPLRYE